MVIRGLTPIDASFEMMGLHEAYALTRYLFVETWGGKIIFVAGFVVSLWLVVARGSMKPIAVFLMCFFACWLLLVFPCIQPDAATSAMEAEGFTDMTTAALLEKGGYQDIKVNPLMDVISRVLNSVVTGSVAMLEKAGHQGCSFLKSPFLMVKLSSITSEIIAAGVTDTALQARTVRFYQDYFLVALQELQARGQPVRNLWPGDGSVMALYKEAGATEWRALKEQLYAECNKNERYFDRTFELFYDGNIDKDRVVRALLSAEVLRSQALYAHEGYAARVATFLTGSHIRDTGFMNSTRLDISCARAVVGALPYVLGVSVFVLYAVFPAAIAGAVAVRNLTPVVGFLKILAGVKSWVLAWALMDRGALFWFFAVGREAGVDLWRAPGVDCVVPFGCIVLAGSIGWMSIGTLMKTNKEAV
ncbi:MAG: hypothetical protein HQL19_07210 [Candidatus Omnitrophica bacterium]|nr:hypothetical protein [Candidatus Omnitrophota bacterium]